MLAVILVPSSGGAWKGNSVDMQTGIKSYISSVFPYALLLMWERAGKHWELEKALRHVIQGKEVEAISE